MKIRTGDKVKIISGNDRGKEAKVLAVFSREGRILAEGVNMRIKHVRPRKRGAK
ncbi:MAG: 50S ribosomal protein L24 [Candidatus Sungbacteria bacterium]|nr:50S ribosomal protein L24 [Candidatus Sungbacteria bacterium]